MDLNLKKMQQALRDNSHLMCLVGMLGRPGVTLLFTMLEYRCFRPRTPRNRWFDIVILKCNEVSLAACVFDQRMVPPGALDVILAETELEAKDNNNLLILGNGVATFPLSGSNVRHLTFISGHWAYKPYDHEAASTRDKERIDAEEAKPEPPDLPPIPEGDSVEQLVRGTCLSE